MIPNYACHLGVRQEEIDTKAKPMASNALPTNGQAHWVRNVALASALFGGLSGALLGGCVAGIREMSTGSHGDSMIVECLGLGLIAGSILGAGAGALFAWLLK
jgi:hypothetical protein